MPAARTSDCSISKCYRKPPLLSKEPRVPAQPQVQKHQRGIGVKPLVSCPDLHILVDHEVEQLVPEANILRSEEPASREQNVIDIVDRVAVRVTWRVPNLREI